MRIRTNPESVTALRVRSMHREIKSGRNKIYIDISS